MERYCISLEQAKRLKELGLDRGANHVWFEADSADKGTLIFFDGLPSWIDHRPRRMYWAYSVGELGDLLPGRAVSLKCDDKYEREKGNFTAYSQRQGECPPFYGETEAQARGALLIYLLENNLLK